MAEIFPPWTNRAPRFVALGAVGLLGLTSLGVWYTFSPEYTDVGYKPRQPIPFSHRLHVGELRIDCRYCHRGLEVSPMATVPDTATCLNCHSLVARDRPGIARLEESLETGEPIHWIRVHKLPDYAYFDHRPHLRAGVACTSCHGNVATMDEIRQEKPLSMSWCLSCHRDPEPYLGPPAAVFDPEWTRAATAEAVHPSVAPPTDCSGCHR